MCIQYIKTVALLSLKINLVPIETCMFSLFENILLYIFRFTEWFKKNSLETV